MSKLTKLAALVSRRHVFFHPVRTGKFLNAIMRDDRIHLSRKVLFSLLVSALMVILVFPEAVEETVLSTLLPLIGTIIGIPLSVGIDWGTFAVLSVYLLRVFPAAVVNEHYARLVLEGKNVEGKGELLPTKTRLGQSAH